MIDIRYPEWLFRQEAHWRMKERFLRFVKMRQEEERKRAERVGPYAGLDDWDLQP